MIRNLGWALLHHGLGRGALFVFFLLLPTIMDVGAVGRLTLMYTTLLLILQPLLDTALGTIIIKSTARGQPPRIRRAFAVLAWGLSGTAAAIALVTAARPFLFPLLPMLGAAVLGAIALNGVYAWRRGLDDFRMEGVVGSCHRLAVLLALLAFAVAGQAGPIAAAAALIIGVTVAGLVVVAAFRTEIGALVRVLRSARGTEDSTAALLREGFVLGATGILGLLYLRIDVVMLGLLSGDGEVGLYFTGARILEASYVVPTVVMLVAFPRLARPGGQRSLLRKTLVGMGAAGVAAGVSLAVAGTVVIPHVYGADWIRMGKMLTVLSLSAPAVYLGYVLTQALVAIDLQARSLAVGAVGLALNIALNLVLIPPMGGVGAAWATVATEAVVTIGAALVLSQSARKASSAGQS